MRCDTPDCVNQMFTTIEIIGQEYSFCFSCLCELNSEIEDIIDEEEYDPDDIFNDYDSPNGHGIILS